MSAELLTFTGNLIGTSEILISLELMFIQGKQDEKLENVNVKFITIKCLIFITPEISVFKCNLNNVASGRKNQTLTQYCMLCI